MDILRYKGFEGTAEVDVGKGICHGRLLFVSDAVTYQSKSPADLQKEFEAAVDDYLETCADLGRQPQKPLTGVFNVRVPPQLHRQARIRSVEAECSLNEVVVRALECYLTPALSTEAIMKPIGRALEHATNQINQIAQLTMRMEGPDKESGGSKILYDYQTSSKVSPKDPYPDSRWH